MKKSHLRNTEINEAIFNRKRDVARSIESGPIDSVLSRAGVSNILALLILGAMALSVVSYGASDSPASSASTGNTQNQGQTTKTNSATGNSQPKSSALTFQTPASTVINIGTAAQTSPQPDHSKKEEAHVAVADWWVAGATMALAIITLFLAIFTGALWWVTLQLSRDAKHTGESQAARMQESILEATRSTAAMEKIATATKDNASLMQGVMHKQMRAYVAVEIGKATYQDENLRFEVDPVLINTGFTPAKNIGYKITTDILPADLPIDFVFRDYGNERNNDASLGPRQSFVIHGIVPQRFPNEEVPDIMAGNRRKLYVWGTVTYDDVFGGSWHTNFCHSFVFIRINDKDVSFSASYNPTHNDSK